MREIKEIIVHCSVSGSGSAASIDEKHRCIFGWKSIGYHFVILNGIRTYGGTYSAQFDGAVEPGRAVANIGAHVRGHNRNSIGVCLIGARLFTPIQLFEALPDLLEKLMARYELTLADIVPHCHYDPAKNYCPGFDLPRYFRILRSLGRF